MTTSLRRESMQQPSTITPRVHIGKVVRFGRAFTRLDEVRQASRLKRLYTLGHM